MLKAAGCDWSQTLGTWAQGPRFEQYSIEVPQALKARAGAAAGKTPRGPSLGAPGHRWRVGVIAVHKGCVWPANCRDSCGAPAQQGRICSRHLKRVQGMAGTLACAWPGCARRAWDRRGLCSFHWKIAFGLIER